MVTLKPYHYKRRYIDWKDPPSQCDNCQEPLVTLTNNHVVYGRNFGEWPMIYLCMSCGAFCGCHPFSVFPLGLMGDDGTRGRRRSLPHGAGDGAGAFRNRDGAERDLDDEVRHQRKPL